MTEQPQAFRRAGTLIVFRELGNHAPDILMTERSQGMSFAGGALVFPGGAVDTADEELAHRIGASDDWEDVAARIAAIRETLEEAGLAVGFDQPCDAATTQQMRNALSAGISFGAMLKEFGVALDLDQLSPFARWFPKHRLRRVFDTRFYVAKSHGESAHISPDMNETRQVFWMQASQVLTMADNGQAKIIFPTRRNLERIAQFANLAQAQAHLAQFPVTTVSPWHEMRDGVEHLCIPENIGYPVTSEPAERAMRG